MHYGSHVPASSASCTILRIGMFGSTIEVLAGGCCPLLGYYMGMGCPTVAVRMLSSYVSGAARIKGLHLQKSEGVRPVKPL